MSTALKICYSTLVGEGFINTNPSHFSPMTATFQANILDKGYNGWTNYETWNVALWLQNDEDLYYFARDVKSYDDIVDHLYENCGCTETPDGVKWNDSKINHIEINEMLQDF